MSNQQQVLRQPFDIEIHKKTFINYLEVIIDENGVVHYAIPSHQEYLINHACRSLGVTRERLMLACPVEYYCDFMNWLCKLTNAIAVWDSHLIGKPNRKQLATLNKLRSENLYQGGC